MFNSYRVTVSNHSFYSVYFVSAESIEAAKAAALRTANESITEEEGVDYTWSKAEESDVELKDGEVKFFDSGSEG